MKTCLAIAVLGCCSFAAIAFAQKPVGGGYLADLLPVGTCFIVSEDRDNFSIEIVRKNTKSEDLDDASNESFDKAIASASRDNIEHLKRMKEGSAAGLRRPIYEVLGVGVDYVLVRLKEREDNSRRAFTFTSIRAINIPGDIDAK